jgi:hypothetical protein
MIISVLHTFVNSISKSTVVHIFVSLAFIWSSRRYSQREALCSMNLHHNHFMPVTCDQINPPYHSIRLAFLYTLSTGSYSDNWADSGAVTPAERRTIESSPQGRLVASYLHVSAYVSVCLQCKLYYFAATSADSWLPHIAPPPTTEPSALPFESH